MPGLYAIGEPIPVTAPKHGLRASAIDHTLLTPKWELGVTMPPPESCVTVNGWAGLDCATLQEDIPFADPVRGTDRMWYDVDPFVIESAFACDASALTTTNFAGRARRQLEAGTSKFMETELSTFQVSVTANAPHLNDANATVIAGGPYSPLMGLYMLGAAMSNSFAGSVGMFHAPTWIVDAWIAKGGMLIEEQGVRLVTKNRGDVIVSGTGYTGLGPTGEDAPTAGQSWVYATGPVVYRLGDIEVFPDTVSEAFERATNEVEYRAVRTAMIAFDPCQHFGVLVDLAIAD